MRATDKLIKLALGQHLGAAFPIDQEPELNNAFVDLTQEHRLVPLVWSSLAKLPGVHPNRVAVLDLQARHRYRIVEEELLRVSRIAADAGVQIGVVKGVVNAERWFPADPSVRRCSDIDLFLDPGDVDGTDRLLSALDPENALRGHAGQLMVSGVLPDVPITSGPVLIEIHRNPMTLALSDSRLKALWDSTVPATTRVGAQIRTLDPTAALLNALINSAKDNHAYLLQVIEIGRALQDPSIDWPRFQQAVRDVRWDTVIDDAIRYVCELLGQDLPPINLQPDRTAAWTLNRIAPRADRLGGLESWRRAQRFCKLDLAVPGSRAKTVSGIVTRTFSPDAYITAFAPDLKGPYPLRAARFWVRRQQYVKGRRSSLAGPRSGND